MQIHELKTKLSYLIEKYVDSDQKKKEDLRRLLAKDSIPVKGILADLTPYLKGCSEDDGHIIKEIVFNYA